MERFRHITLPMLRPTLLFGAVITGIGYLQFFEEPFVMTKGGPLDSTLSVTFFTYDQFGYGNYGYAAAAATCCSSRSCCSPSCSSGCSASARRRSDGLSHVMARTVTSTTHALRQRRITSALTCRSGLLCLVVAPVRVDAVLARSSPSARCRRAADLVARTTSTLANYRQLFTSSTSRVLHQLACSSRSP